MNSFTPPNNPYSKGFETCLDDGIREIVLILVEKGYLPCSSCEGHSMLQPRFITLCFNSNELRENTKTAFSMFPTESLDTLSIEKYENLTIVHQSLEDEVKGFNHVFGRNFEKYWFLRIYIGAYTHIEDEHWISIKLKQLRVIIFNFLFRNFLTWIFKRKCQALEDAWLH